jgi:nucleotide-binding universal stress UspA family protein
MPPVQHVVVATDRSPGGERALVRAARLADAVRAPRLTVVEFPTAGGTLADAVRTAAADRPTLVIVPPGAPRGLGDVFRRTPASDLLRPRLWPVVVAKRLAERPYRRVLVATDLSPASRAALELALELAPGADVCVLHAIPPVLRARLRVVGASDAELRALRRRNERAARRALDAFLDTTDLRGRRVERLVCCGDASQSIATVAARVRAGLVALGVSSRPAVARLLGSVSEDVVRDVRCDVLLVPAPSGAGDR